MAKRRSSSPKQSQDQEQKQEELPDVSATDLQDASLDGVSSNYGNQAAAELLGLPTEDLQSMKTVDLEPEMGGEGDGEEEGTEDLGGFQAKLEEDSGQEEPDDDQPDDSGGSGSGSGSGAGDDGEEESSDDDDEGEGKESKGGGGGGGSGGGSSDDDEDDEEDGGGGNDSNRLGGMNPEDLMERARTSTGNIMTDAIHEPMKKFLGHDFSHVRLHYDSRAGELADELQTDAFTIGTDVYFGSGKYRPNSPQGNVTMVEQLNYVAMDDAHLARKSTTGQLQMGRLNEKNMMDGRLVGLDAVRKASKIGKDKGGGKDGKLRKAIDPLRMLSGEQKKKKFTPRPIAPNAVVFPSQAYSRPKLARSIDPTGGKRLKDVGMDLGGVGDKLEKMLGKGGGQLDNSLDGLSTKGMFKLGMQVFGEDMQEMPKEMLASQAVKIAQSANPGALPYKKELESEFGVKLDNVKVFFGGKAKEACQMVQARAFAVQNVVVFADASPSKDVVKHEITHVIQQGGHEKGKGLSGIPDKLPMSSPSDKEEHEAENVAADRGSGHSVKEGGSEKGVSRILDISVSQEEVMSAVVDNVVPDGYGANIGNFIARGDGIQGVLDGVKGSINMSSAFPVSDISTLFGGDAFDYLDPTQFMESIKPSGDTIVEQFATGVMGFCDATLGVLDGLLGTITGILDLVETFVSLLENAAKVLNIIAGALAAIAAALAATLFGAGAAAVLFNIAAQCRNVASTISNITKVVRGFLDPIMAVIDVLEQVRDTVQQIRDIAEIVKMACDVYDWLTADTAADRDAASADLAGSVGSMSNVLGMFTGGIYGEFATSFWNNAQPFVVGQLQGAHGGAQTGIGGEAQNTALDNSFSTEPHADIPGGITQHGTDSAVSGDKSGKPDEAVSAYKQIEAEEKAKNPPKEDDPEPPDLSKQVRSDTASKASQQKPQGDPAKAADPGQAKKGGGGGSGTGSIVTGATGLAANIANMGLGGDVMQNTAVATGAKMLEDQGYHGGVDELFDYINNVMVEKETAESLDTQGQQRKQEAVAIEQNADQAIVAMEESKKVSEAQEESTKANEEAGHEGVGFMDYIMNLSATLQQKLEEKINEAFGVNKDSDAAGNKGLLSGKGAEDQAKKGHSSGGGALGIIKRVSAAALKLVLGKILEKIDVGKILQKIIPGDLGNIFEMVTQFIGMATSSKDQAKAKQDEAKGAQNVLNQQISRDQASQAESQANQTQADSNIAEAQRTKQAAIKAQQDADQQRQEANQLRASLDQEQAQLENKAQGQMNEAGPLRPRDPVQQVEVPGGYDNLGTFPAAGDLGEMPGGNAQLTISPDRGNPDAVGGPTRSTTMGMDQRTPWSDGGVTDPQASQLATRQDASRGTDGTNGPVGAGGPGSSAQGGFEPGEAFEGPPGGGASPSLDAPAGGEELVTQRELDEDIAQVDEAVEARRPDPNVPPSIEEQVDDIQTPVVEASSEQEEERFDSLTETYEAIPEVETLYDTLEQLPEPSPDNPEYTQLRPMSTGGLGYNSQHVIIDSDVAQVSQWGGRLPTDSHLTDPPAHGPLGEAPHYVAPTPLEVPASSKTDMPGLELPQIDVVEAPFEPTTEALRDNPPAMGAAEDVMDSVVMEAALSDSLQNSNRIVDAHEAEEEQLVGEAQTEMVQIQLTHEDQASTAWTDRDQTLRQTRTEWVQQQQQTVDQHDNELVSTETTLYDQAEDEMQSGLANADGTLREGEQQAWSIEQKADQDSQQLNRDAQQKASTLWGWFRQHVAEFTAHITDMVHGLWSQASGAIHNVLHGAEVFAKNTISEARTATANTLATLSQEMSSLYGSLKGQLAELGEAATGAIVEAVEAAYAQVQQVADQAASAAQSLFTRVDAAIDSLVQRTQAALQEEWNEFNDAAEEVREARARFPGEVDGADQLTDGDDGRDTTGAEAEIEVQGVDAGGDVGPGSDVTPQPVRQVEGGPGGSALEGDDAAQVVDSWVNSPVSDRAENWDTLSTTADEVEVAHDGVYQDALEPLPVQLAGNEQQFDGQVSLGAPAGRQVDAAEDGELGDLGMEDIEQPDLSGLNPSRDLNLPPIDVDNPDLVPRANEVAGDLNSIQVSNPGIRTSPGPAPQIPLTGPTDPTRIDTSATQGLDGAFEATSEARQILDDSPGAEVINPGHVDEEREIQPLQPYTTSGPIDEVPNQSRWIDTGMEQPWRGEADQFYGPDHLEALRGLSDQASEALTERDRQRSELMGDHHQQADDHNAQIQQEQLDVVERERQAVIEARETARQEQADAYESLQSDLTQEHERVRRSVDTRARDDQNRINTAFRDAERDAESEVSSAERDAEEEKRQAERDANDRSWWERAASWVRSQIDRVKSAINSIFEAVRDRVADIIADVRSLAETVVREAFDFIRGQIQAFTNMVQQAIDSLVNEVLPAILTELQELVTAAIDLARAFVQEAIRRVTTFVDELVATLSDALDSVLEWFEQTLELLWLEARFLLDDLWANMPELLLEIALLPMNVALAPFNALLDVLGAFRKTSETPSVENTGVADPTAQQRGASGVPGAPDAVQAPPALDVGATREIVPATFDGVPAGELDNYSVRPVDGCVDYYMETNWDSEVYDTAAREMEVDGQLAAALDRFLPEEASAGVKNAANFGWSVSMGLIDAVIIACVKSVPGVGALYMLGEAFRDGMKAGETYNELEDGTVLGLQVVRTIADAFGGIVSNLGDLVSLLEDATLASVVGAPAGVVLGIVATVAAGVATITDSIKVGCDVALVIHSAMKMNEARREGDFRRAAAYQNLATSAGIDAICDTISLVGSATDLVACGTLFNGAVGNMSEGFAAIGKQATRSIEADRFINAALGTGGTLKNGEFELEGFGDWWKALSGPAARIFKAFANPMAATSGPDGLLGGGYIDPGEVEISGAAGDELRSARQRSAAQFEEHYTNLAGNNPRFTQKAVNEAIETPEPSAAETFDSFMKPSTFFTAYRDLLISIPDIADDAAGGGGAAMLDGIATTLDTVAGPMVEKINEVIDTWEPGLDAMLENAAEALRQQEISLQFARESMGDVDDFMELLAGFADDGAQLDSLFEGAAETLETGKLTAEGIGMPDWVPSFLYQWAFDVYNASIDVMIASIHWANENARPVLDDFIEGQTEKAQAHIAEIQEVLREGGQAEVFLQEAHETITDAMADFAEMVAGWDLGIPGDFTDAVNYLRAEAERQRQDQMENRVERFRAWVASYGQGQVDAWKGEYADDVEGGYKPRVPQWEIDAVNNVYGMVIERLDFLEEEAALWDPYNERYRELAEREKDAALGLAGGEGRGNMEEFWRHADRLAEVAANVGL